MNKPITAYAVVDIENFIKRVYINKHQATNSCDHGYEYVEPITICPEGWVAVDPSTHDISPKTAMSITMMEQAERYRAEMMNKFVLVPKEPTEEMLEAAYGYQKALYGHGVPDAIISDVYKAMIKQLEGVDNE